MASFNQINFRFACLMMLICRCLTIAFRNLFSFEIKYRYEVLNTLDRTYKKTIQNTYLRGINFLWIYLPLEIRSIKVEAPSYLFEEHRSRQGIMMEHFSWDKNTKLIFDFYKNHLRFQFSWQKGLTDDFFYKLSRLEKTLNIETRRFSQKIIKEIELAEKMPAELQIEVRQELMSRIDLFNQIQDNRIQKFWQDLEKSSINYLTGKY